MTQNHDYHFIFSCDTGESNGISFKLTESLSSPPVAMDKPPGIDSDKTLCLVDAAHKALTFVKL